MENKKGELDINGFKLNYLIEGEGPLVLCIGSTLFYPRVFSNELREKLQFVFIDHCGFVSPPDRNVLNSEFSLDNLIRHIEIIRAELRLDKFFILGHSGHAFMALEYAKKYSQHILGTIMIAVSPDYSEKSHSLIDIFFKESASEIRQLYYSNAMSELPARIEKSPLKRFVHFCLCSGARNWYKHDFDARHLWEGIETNMQMIDYVWGTIFRDIDITKKLNAYTIPTILMLGKYDYVTGPSSLWDETKSSFKNLELVLFEESGHYPMYEQSTLFNDALITWIEKTNTRKQNSL